MSDKETDEQTKIEYTEGYVCLNCGTNCTSKYCPECGQSTSTPKRLNSKTFGKTFMASVTRLSPGLFVTTWTLLTRPWVVVRDYLRGRHATYTPPFTLAIQIFFLCAIIEAVLTELLGLDVTPSINVSNDSPTLVSKFFNSSQLARYLLVSIPISLSVFIAFLPFGSRRFNVYEYISAALYITIPISIFALIFILLEKAQVDGWLIGMMLFLLCYWIWGNIIVFKVFHVKKWWRKLLTFAWFNTILIFFFMLLGTFSRTFLR